MDQAGKTPTPVQKPSHIRTIALIIGLFFVTAFLLYIALAPGKNSAPKKVAQPITPKPTKVMGHTLLSLSPRNAVISSYSGSLDVLIDSHGDKVTGVQLDISYDPKIVTNVAILPGDFFAKPQVLLKNIDPALGKIFYILVLPPQEKAATGSGKVATISFSANGTSTVSFGPKTKVTAEGAATSVLLQTQDATVTTSQTLRTPSQ